MVTKHIEHIVFDMLEARNADYFNEILKKVPMDPNLSQIMCYAVAKMSELKRDVWSNDRIKNEFCLRNTNQILDDGTTFYMGCCHDLSLALVHYFRQMEVDSSLVLESIDSKAYPGPLIHIATELNYNGQFFFVDPMSYERVAIGVGAYTDLNPDIIRQKSKIVLNSSSFDDNTTFVDILKNFFSDIESPSDLGKITHGFDFDENVRRIIDANTPRSYEFYCKKVHELLGRDAKYL